MCNIRHIIIYDTKEDFGNLLPITFTRPISNIRVGITTIREKWESMLPGEYRVETADFMSEVFRHDTLADDATLHICSNVIPTEDIANAVEKLKSGEKRFIWKPISIWDE